MAWTRINDRLSADVPAQGTGWISVRSEEEDTVRFPDGYSYHCTEVSDAERTALIEALGGTVPPF